MNEIMIKGAANAGMTGGVAKSSGQEGDGSGFGEVFKKAIESVNNSLHEADSLAAGLASGEHANIHETMIAMEKAGISFRLATKVQGKVIAAYQEIMRMQL